MLGVGAFAVMTRKHLALTLAAAAALLGAAACSTLTAPVSNPTVPQPAKSVDLNRYLGQWYEIARYDVGSFQQGCEASTAGYSLRDDGEIRVLNTCRDGSPTGEVRSAEGRARVVENSGNAKLEVSFFGPFYFGDYWVLDHAEDYSWSIVGEPSGRFLWLLSRTPDPSPEARAHILARTAELGYDTSRLHMTRHN
jgi:apolipoprotein D and lipocalin family protein